MKYEVCHAWQAVEEATAELPLRLKPDGLMEEWPPVLGGRRRPEGAAISRRLLHPHGLGRQRTVRRTQRGWFSAQRPQVSPVARLFPVARR
jgi:hypothetical protein